MFLFLHTCNTHHLSKPQKENQLFCTLWKQLPFSKHPGRHSLTFLLCVELLLLLKASAVVPTFSKRAPRPSPSGHARVNKLHNPTDNGICSRDFSDYSTELVYIDNCCIACEQSELQLPASAQLLGELEFRVVVGAMGWLSACFVRRF